MPSSQLDDDSSSSFSASSPIDQGIGLSDPRHAQGRRIMLDLVNRLLSTGVQIDINLPQIAVIGSQSAGKSSLIESISGITLPRAAGTCTRCPTECRLARSEAPWRCTVSLRFITNAKGEKLGQARNEVFGAVITDKRDVEERIRRAQRAILNPSTPYKNYLQGEDEDGVDAELSFSTNCVSLQISGPDVADLSFCDLPGLIASVSRGGKASDIQLVEGLVTSYIKNPSCIILLTVACETDFENQGAHGLAKRHDPEGKRTIGVLTKPDRIPEGEESGWLQFIRNEKEALENNWYCVKQPSSSDLKLGITWPEARSREDEFFSLTSPWAELDPMYQKYLRTSNLVTRLSSILSDLISKRLPEIQDELENSMNATHELLNKLPKAPSQQPMNEIANLLHVFTTDLTRHVEGLAQKDALLQTIRPEQETFRRKIRATAPNFVPFERRYAGIREFHKPTFLANEEVDDGPDDVEDLDSDGSDGGQMPTVVDMMDAIYVDEVLEQALQSRTRELPGNYPFVVQRTYIETIMAKWRAPASLLSKSVGLVLLEQMRALVAKHFASYGQGILEQRVKVILQEHLKQCMAKTEERIEWLLCLEQRPFTLNTHYLADYKDKFFSYYKGSRNKDRHGELMQRIHDFRYKPISEPMRQQFRPTEAPVPPAPTGVAKILAGLLEVGLIDCKPEDIPKLLPPDRMEPALLIMADVRAYFQVAYKRFVDNIPLAIDHELVFGIERGVLQTLYDGLGINGPDCHRICREFSQESPSVAGRREELMKKLERLEIASKELLHMGF